MVPIRARLKWRSTRHCWIRSQPSLPYVAFLSLVAAHAVAGVLPELRRAARARPQPRLSPGAAANRRRRDLARPRADLQPGGALCASARARAGPPVRGGTRRAYRTAGGVWLPGTTTVRTGGERAVPAAFSVLSAPHAGRRAAGPHQNLRQCPAAAAGSHFATWQPAAGTLGSRSRATRHSGAVRPPRSIRGNCRPAGGAALPRGYDFGLFPRRFRSRSGKLLKNWPPTNMPVYYGTSAASNLMPCFRQRTQRRLEEQRRL